MKNKKEWSNPELVNLSIIDHTEAGKPGPGADGTTPSSNAS